MCRVITDTQNHISAIVCGPPTDHVCNENATVYLLDDGSRVDYTEQNFEKHKEQIRGGSVACSVCGRAAIDNAPYL